MANRIVLASVSAALVEEDGKVSLELSEDSEVAKDLPIAGPIIAKALPAKESIPLTSAAGALSAISGVVGSVKSLFAPHTASKPGT